MNWKSAVSGLCWLIVAAVWSGCVTEPPPKPLVCDSDRVRVGDKLTVTFILPGTTASSEAGDKSFEVREDGTINMPTIGPQQVAGKKLAELEKELQAKYVPNIYRQLTLVIRPGDRFYTVGGEVRTPGRNLYLGNTTVLRAITSAGDFTEFANRKKVEIIRVNGEREVMNCVQARKNPQKYDRPICPGDAIYVPRSL